MVSPNADVGNHSAAIVAPGEEKSSTGTTSRRTAPASGSRAPHVAPRPRAPVPGASAEDIVPGAAERALAKLTPVATIGSTMGSRTVRQALARQRMGDGVRPLTVSDTPPPPGTSGAGVERRTTDAALWTLIREPVRAGTFLERDGDNTNSPECGTIRVRPAVSGSAGPSLTSGARCPGCRVRTDGAGWRCGHEPGGTRCWLAKPSDPGPARGVLSSRESDRD